MKNKILEEFMFCKFGKRNAGKIQALKDMAWNALQREDYDLLIDIIYELKVLCKERDLYDRL